MKMMSEAEKREEMEAGSLFFPFLFPVWLKKERG